jgi:hypothetical protein
MRACVCGASEGDSTAGRQSLEAVEEEREQAAAVRRKVNGAPRTSRPRSGTRSVERTCRHQCVLTRWPYGAQGMAIIKTENDMYAHYVPTRMRIALFDANLTDADGLVPSSVMSDVLDHTAY